MLKIWLLFLACTTLLDSFVLTQQSSQDVMELAVRITEFAMTLYRKIACTNDDNIFFSPLSVSAALVALSEGAQSHSLDQLLRGISLMVLQQSKQPGKIPEFFQQLQGSLMQDGALQPDQATAFFIRQQVEVEKTFSDQAKKLFNADISNVDFSNTEASKSTINEYFRSRTGGNVRSVIENINPQTLLILINSIFFQAKWELPFNSSFTQEERFYVNKYNIAKVPMMFRADKYYLAYDRFLKVGVLKLPLQGKVAMLVLLPDKDVDYTSIDEELTADHFFRWLKQLKKTKLEVQLPRFKLERSYTLKKILPNLGIVDVFEDNSDLSGLSKVPELKLTECIHKAVIVADEEGKSVSATMETSIRDVLVLPRLAISRPFIFIIYHEVTNTVLFMGRVINPTDN